MSTPISTQAPALEIRRTPGSEQMEILTLLGKGLPGRIMVDDNRRKGVVVDSQNLRAAKPISRSDCILHTHGEIIADAECGELEWSGLQRGSHQFDIPRQRGVATVIKGAMGCLHQESSRLSPIATIRHAA